MKDINMKPGFTIESCITNMPFTLVCNREITNIVCHYSYYEFEYTEDYRNHENMIGRWQPKGTKLIELNK